MCYIIYFVEYSDEHVMIEMNVVLQVCVCVCVIESYIIGTDTKRNGRDRCTQSRYLSDLRFDRASCRDPQSRINKCVEVIIIL